MAHGVLILCPRAFRLDVKIAALIAMFEVNCMGIEKLIGEGTHLFQHLTL